MSSCLFAFSIDPVDKRSPVYSIRDQDPKTDGAVNIKQRYYMYFGRLEF